MACCGGKRLAVPTYQPTAPSPERSVYGAEAIPPVLFEYVGRTGLTTTGPITGRRYRFDETGARLAVDGRDAPSLAGVPNLRRVPSTG